MAPSDLSAWREITFWARGDGKTYTLMLFAESRGFLPSTRTFVAGEQWERVGFLISDFDNIDGRDLLGVLFAGGPRPGSFSFQIDNVEFR